MKITVELDNPKDVDYIKDAGHYYANRLNNPIEKLEGEQDAQHTIRAAVVSLSEAGIKGRRMRLKQQANVDADAFSGDYNSIVTINVVAPS